MSTRGEFEKVIVLSNDDIWMYGELITYICNDYNMCIGDGDEDSEGVDYLLLFEDNPDILKIYGGRTCFCDIVVNKTKYVIYLSPYYGTMECDEIKTEDELNEGVKLMLTQFFSNELTEYYTHNPDYNTWRHFDEIKDGIAYRGGSGYVYTLWEYNK
jgi:hypothetical protein